MVGIESVECWNCIINQLEGVLPDIGWKRLGQKTVIIVNVGSGQFGILNTQTRCEGISQSIRVGLVLGRQVAE
jgi:hypothetical protein